MIRVGLVGAGAMGSALGALGRRRRSSAHVRCRAQRPDSHPGAAGLDLAATLDEGVVACDFVALGSPRPRPRSLRAESIAQAAERHDVHPLVIDFNAIAPSTVRRIGIRQGEAGCDQLDGSVSGPTTKQ